jgi:hypothetical protein
MGNSYSWDSNSRFQKCEPQALAGRAPAQSRSQGNSAGTTITIITNNTNTGDSRRRKSCVSRAWRETVSHRHRQNLDGQGAGVTYMHIRPNPRKIK